MRKFLKLSKTKLTLLALLLASRLGSGYASAHDFDCEGQKVPANVKASCCGEGDAHLLSPTQWYEDDKGTYHVIVHGKDYAVTDSNGVAIQPFPSGNSCNYVWYRTFDGNGIWQHDNSGDEIHFYCIQLSMTF